MKKDYSQILRKDVDVENTWKIDDIFKNYEEWAENKQEVEVEIEKIEERKIAWTDSAKNLLNFLKFTSNISQSLTKLYLYSSLIYDTNMEDSKAQAMEGEISRRRQRKLGMWWQYAPRILWRHVSPLLYLLPRLQREQTL